MSVTRDLDENGRKPDLQTRLAAWHGLPVQVAAQAEPLPTAVPESSNPPNDCKVFGEVLLMAAATNAAKKPFGAQEHVNIGKLIKAEMKEYLSLPPVPMTVELLPWWAHHESRFPHLAELAADLHAPPGSGATLERAFSHAGYALNRRRAPRLDPKMAAKIIFCHENIVREVV